MSLTVTASCGHDKVIDSPACQSKLRAFAESTCKSCASKRKAGDPDLSDWAAVDRLVKGVVVHASRHDRMAAVDLLTRQGLPARVIADRIGITARTVHRIRTRLRRLA